MEGGSSVDGGGGGVLGAAQEPREDKAEEKAGAAEGRGSPMKFRLRARAPHGVGALLLIGGAAVLGAAVVAWRHAARRGKDGAESRRSERQPAKQEALNGGVVEDEKGGATAAREIDDPPHENLSRDKTGAGSNEWIQDGDMTGQIQQIHEDTEIVADESSEPVGNSDDDSRREPIEISMHAVDGNMTEEIQQIHDDKEIVSNESDSEPVDKSDCSSRSGPTEVSIHDVDNENVEKFDHNSRRDPTEIAMHFVVEKLDHNASMIPVEITTHDMENESVAKVDEYSSKKDIKKEIAPNDNKDVDISGQSAVCIKGPGIVLHEHISHNDGAQEPESMENTPTVQLMMHQEQLLDDMMTETVAETEEEKPGEQTITDKNVSEQEEEKASAEPVQLVRPPVLSSLVKPTEKKVPQVPGRNEMGMKLEQDCTNGALLKKHDLTKGGAARVGALMTVDQRSAMALLALVLAVTIGITIVLRIYAPLQAT